LDGRWGADMPDLVGEILIEILDKIHKRITKSTMHSGTAPVIVKGGAGQRVPFQAAGLEPGMYTIQFDIDIDASKGYEPTAEIRWSVRGNTVRRVINVRQGCMISGPCEAANVLCYDTSSDDDTVGGQYQVSINLTPGVRPTVTDLPNLKVTNKADTEAGGSPFFGGPQTIPTNSGVIAVKTVVYPAGTGVVRVTVKAADGSVLQQYDAGQHNEYVPLPNGAVTVLWENVSGANATCQAFWGIDG